MQSQNIALSVFNTVTSRSENAFKLFARPVWLYSKFVDLFSKLNYGSNYD